MELKLTRQKYNAEIFLYYQHDFDYCLAEEIIEQIWPSKGNGQGQAKANFQLIQDHKATVYKMEFDGRIYYIKSYAYRDILKILKNWFRPVEGVRYFATSAKLLNAGIAVAKPVLALTRRRNLFLVDSIFVMEEVSGIDLETYLLKCDDKNLREQIVKKIAVIWSKLIKRKFLHLDPLLRNFMIYPDNQGDIQVELIDADSITHLPFLPAKMACKKNLAKLKRKHLNLTYYSVHEIDLFYQEFSKAKNAALHVHG